MPERECESVSCLVCLGQNFRHETLPEESPRNGVAQSADRFLARIADVDARGGCNQLETKVRRYCP